MIRIVLLVSLAYLRLTASTGALILFGSVQLIMIGWSIKRDTGPTKNEWIGLALAACGLNSLHYNGISLVLG